MILGFDLDVIDVEKSRFLLNIPLCLDLDTEVKSLIIVLLTLDTDVSDIDEDDKKSLIMVLPTLDTDVSDIEEDKKK